MQLTPEQIRANGDADVLERAADILLRRYGLLVAGDLIKALQGRAGEIREEPAKREAEEARVAREITLGDEPGHGYWESGDY